MLNHRLVSLHSDKALDNAKKQHSYYQEFIIKEGRERVVNACHRSAILVVHFIVGDAAVLMAKLGARRSASVYRGEWAYCTRNKAFKNSSFTVRVSA